MSFRTSNNLQKYEYVRIALDNAISLPGNNATQQKMVTNSL